MTGAVFYRGRSQLDGSPIVGIVTDGTTNQKTGNMLQTWILRQHVDPVRAVADGRDASICGSCYHRGAEDRPRTCYVNVGQAPLAVWHAYRRGTYPVEPLAEFVSSRGIPVRLGAYGDPVAIPWSVWSEALEVAPSWTGYTHQWRRKDARPFRAAIMASCDSVADMAEAAAAGWRTFRVGQESAGDILCPSSRGTQCADCTLCAGQRHSRAPSIYIPAHGSAARFVASAV